MNQPEENPTAQVLLILWGAFLVSHGLFLVVGHIVYGQDTNNVADLDVMSYALTGVGAMTALASAVAMPVIARGHNFFTTTILRLALAESATIFGLVLATLGAEMQWVYILTGLGVAAHVAAFPSKREREVHDEGLKADKR